MNIIVEYYWVGIIATSRTINFNCIVFNPLGKTVDPYFKSNNIYYNDCDKNNGKITSLSKDDDWKNLGIPYIVLYKMADIYSYIYKIIEYTIYFTIINYI